MKRRIGTPYAQTASLVSECRLPQHDRDNHVRFNKWDGQRTRLYTGRVVWHARRRICVRVDGTLQDIELECSAVAGDRR